MLFENKMQKEGFFYRVTGQVGVYYTVRKYNDD